MGSPKDEDGHRAWEQQRDVTLANAFYLGMTPVTQAQYEAVIGTNPTDHEKVKDAPVDAVNWHQSVEYCEKLTAVDRKTDALPEDWEYRLPTEAEWEYACRAGSSEPRHGKPLEVAWFHENAGFKPHAVGRKAANAWGFHDMLGNIWEWCQDWFWNANPCRSVRGGSYFNSALFCRSAQRWGWGPGNRGRYCGFRLLAAPVSQRSTETDFTGPVDDFNVPEVARPPSIHHCIETDDFDLALKIFTADPAAINPVDLVPPPLHSCVYQNKAEWVEWLLDHGANIEHQEQDYGATPLTTAVVMRRPRIIRLLVEGSADTTLAMDHAQRGLAGAFEDDPSLDREGYSEIVQLLHELGVDS